MEIGGCESRGHAIEFGGSAVRALTIEGRLKMGFRDASGQEVSFAVPDLPPVTPTSSLGGPRSGDSVALSDLNGRGYIDVRFDVPAGFRLDEDSITDLGDDFVLSSTTGGLTLDSTQAPVLLDAGTHTYRFWTKSTGTVSGVTIANLGNDAAGQQLVGWSTIDVSSGQAGTNPTMPLIVDSSHVNTVWIDVQLASTAGNTPSASTLGAGDFTLSGTGAGNGTPQPQTVFGRIPAGEFVGPGAYADTITATLTF